MQEYTCPVALFWSHVHIVHVYVHTCTVYMYIHIIYRLGDESMEIRNLESRGP